MKTIGSIIITIILVFAQSAQALIPRATFSKPDKFTIRDCDRWDLLVVKFNEKTGIRLRDGQFVTINNADLSELEALLKNYPVIKIARLFQRPENIYEMEKIIGETRSGRELADLNLYYAFGPKTRFEAEMLLEDLNNLDIVECAYAEPIPELPINPVPNILNPPSYVESQEYLDSSPIGVDAYAAWVLPGGKGENIQMIDVELSWAWSHHDLPTPFYQGGTQNSTQSHRDHDHGTAVMGEIAAIENDFGITGIAPQAAVGGQSIDNCTWPENVGACFDQASAALEPGDVWLIELHGPGPGPDEAYVPMEWWQNNYDAIANSTALGRICVEAGGNGSANLDAALYEGKFDRTIRDSLAIMVGAGTPYDMVPEWFTNYGSRMDVNGWGSAIYSTGYGDLYSSEGENLYYTSLFGGTSGASPIVVGVCCVAQSIYKELTGAILSPEVLRAALTETGAPQPEPVTQQIGPRPDLAALLVHEIFNVEGIYLDEETYSCSAETLVTVRHPDVIPPVFATISSTTEPAGEILTLHEIEPGIFTQSIQLTENPPQTGDGLLSVSDGDIITVEYAGLSDSTTATVDCLAPVITTVTVTEIRDSQAAISWQTNEPATSVIHYGTGIPDETVVSNDLTTNHSLVLENLDECTLYVFYVESADAALNNAIDDNGGLNYSFTTWERIIFMEENLDSDPGWNISGGQWAYGQPQGLGGSYGGPDPSSGFTGNNVYGYNLAGDYANNIPEYHLTTPSLNMSDAVGSILRFQRWLGVEEPQYDHAYVSISNDGSTWTDLWNNDGEVTDHDWILMEFDISDWADGQPTIYIRWTMGQTDSVWTCCGWNIDDIEIICVGPCSSTTPTPTPDCINHGDVNFSDEVTASDAQLAFQIALGSYTPSYLEECAADCNADGEVTASDAQEIFLTALGSGACADPV